MKKLRIGICLIGILAGLFLFTSSSPWEGAGAVAPAGELPANGFFIATNSFPRNTVVDITNIETGRSTRAIVGNTLNSPGLLAIVSREAAELIGMRAGSVSRIRIVQPSDPIAYLRFTENVAATGNPGVTTENVIDEEALLADVYAGDTYTPPSAQTHPAPAATPSSGGVTGPSYIIEPEWGGTDRLNIVDVPGFNVDPVTHEDAAPVHTPVEPIQTPVEPPVQTVIAEPVSSTPEQSDPVETPPEQTFYIVEQVRPDIIISERELDDIIKDISERIDETDLIEVVKEPDEFIEETVAEDVDKETPDFIAEVELEDVEKEANEFIDEEIRDEVVKETPEWEEPVQVVEVPTETPVETPTEVTETQTETPSESPTPHYELVQTEEQPPASSLYGINPDDIIPGVAIARPVERSPQEIIEESPSVEPIAEQTPVVIAEPVDDPVVTPESAVPVATPEPVVPVEQPPSSTQFELVPTQPQAPQVVQQPQQQPQPQQPLVTTDRTFSVRTISRLDHGQYYVQLATLPADSVERVISQIDRSYDPVIFRDSSNMYRVLIGPLNQGESAAILARFRSIGYRDAFVRRGS